MIKNLAASFAGAVALAAMATAMMPVAAYAQEAEDETNDESVIVVTGQFLDTGASSATKLDVPVMDTPFSVASYSDDFLKALETTNVSDLYRYMNGVQRAGNTGYDITIRGFKTGGGDRNAILTDGLPGLSVRFGSPPTVGVDHIELVKGATSVLYGQAQPGGFLNIITKKPLSSAQYQFAAKGNLGVGKYDRAANFLVSVDATGPIDADGDLLYRVVAEAGDGKGFRQDSYERPIYVAPSVEWRMGSATSLLLQGEYRRVRTHYDNMLVAPNRDVSLIASIDTSYQGPDDYLLEKGATGTATFTHEFSDALKFYAGYRYVDHTDDAFGFDNVSLVNDTTLRRRARGQANKRTYSFFDSNMTAKFETFGVEHQMLVGGTLGRETSDFDRLQFYNAPTNGTNPLSLNIDVYNPVHTELPLSAYPAGSTNRRYTVLKSKGLYASDLVSFGELVKLMFGARYADESENRRLLPDGIPETKASTKWLPFAGVVVKPAEHFSVYGSYATSYVPVAAGTQDIFGRNPFSPTLAKAYEGGVKAELFDDRLFLTAAYFDIRKNDTLNNFACPTELPPGQTFPDGVTELATGTCSAPIGAERSRGFELELSAQPIEGLEIAAGYSHTKARIRRSNIVEQIGARLPNSPDDTFNVWMRYDVQDGSLEGLGVGAGFAFIGGRVGYLPTEDEPERLLKLPSYQVVDLGLYYTVSDNIDVTLKMSNVFDERYIESAGFVADIQLVPGTPRAATLTTRFTF